MSTRSVSATPLQAIFRPATRRETAVLLFVAWLIPFAVHLAPWSGARPLGAHLLPMFWTAFVAGYCFGLRTALLVGLFAPALNLLVTGLPAAKFLGGLALELVVFSLLTTWAVRRQPQWIVIAPLGYVVARLASLLVSVVVDGFSGRDVAGQFGQSLIGAVAGLGVLVVINAALVRFYPKPSR
jgi:hypothetical protein